MSAVSRFLCIYLFFSIFWCYCDKKYTQIEGFLRVWFNVGEECEDYDSLIYRILEENYILSSRSRFVLREKKGIFKKDIESYVNMIQAMNKREREFSDHYAFYHGYCDMVEILFDFQTVLRNMLNNCEEREDLVYLRLRDYVTHTNLEDFIDYWDEKFKTGEYYRKRIYEDRELKDIPLKWSGYVRPLPYQMLPINFAPFANTDYIGKGSLYYFIKNRSVLDVKKVLKIIFKKFNFGECYLQELYDLCDTYLSLKTGGHMLQILIPKDKVDKFVFLALPYGTPFRLKIEGLSYNEQKMRHVNSSEFLEKYTNNIFSLKGQGKDKEPKYLVNRIEGRIVFMPDFYEKKNNIKIFRYDFMSARDKQAYKKRLYKIVSNMLTESRECAKEFLGVI